MIVKIRHTLVEVDTRAINALCVCPPITMALVFGDDSSLLGVRNVRWPCLPMEFEALSRWRKATATSALHAADSHFF